MGLGVGARRPGFWVHMRFKPLPLAKKPVLHEQVRAPCVLFDVIFVYVIACVCDCMVVCVCVCFIVYVPRVQMSLPGS